MPVKPAKLLPTQVLPTNRVDKSPVFEEWRPWAGEIEPGWVFYDDLPTARAYLHEQGHMARVAVTHKRELRKSGGQLGKERCVILREPEHADFAKHFGLECRGATLYT